MSPCDAGFSLPPRCRGSILAMRYSHADASALPSKPVAVLRQPRRKPPDGVFGFFEGGRECGSSDDHGGGAW